jgi:hypothetical protein
MTVTDGAIVMKYETLNINGIASPVMRFLKRSLKRL